MAFLPTWAVDGPEIPAAMARRATYALSSGASGVVQVGDLRVLALDVPANAIRIMPGAALISEGYEQATGQTWVAANDAASDDAIVTVPQTDSGAGAVRYVILRVEDPEFAGQAPENPDDSPYARPLLVSTLAGLTYPFVVLARINQPASTATITQAMITDLRQVANPRTRPELRAYTIVTGQEETLTATATAGENFPNAGVQSGVNAVSIPSWATHVSIKAGWHAIIYRGANVYGEQWVEFGPGTTTLQVATKRGGYDSPTGTGNSRAEWTVADTVAIPEALRGTSQPFAFKARSLFGSGTDRPYMNNASSVSLQLQFTERAS